MSTTWIALLRGMNVGGHRITNADLARTFGELGFGSVATYRASGNVMFQADGDGAVLVPRIENGLKEALGYGVPTFLRDAAELRDIASVQPFTEEERAASRGKPQVTFLATVPEARSREAVLAMAPPEDRLMLRGRELYWLPSGGILKTELDVDGIARLLGVGTMRTLGTVAGIAKKLDARR